jgi:hypothetical protein
VLGVDKMTRSGECLGVETALETITMSDRQLRKRPHPVNYAPPAQSWDEPEMQAGPSTTKSSKKGKQPAKKKRVIKSHSPSPVRPQSPAPAPPGSPAPSSYYPITPKEPAHSAFNTLPAAMQRLSNVRPEAIFRLFLTPSLLETISKHTNEYAAEKRGGLDGGRAWKEVTAMEIGVWIGMAIYMGVHQSPELADYWRHDQENPLHPIRTHMSQTRFEQIKRYLHIESPLAPKEIKEHGTVRRLWHSKVDPMLNELRESAQKYRVPSTNVAVDEAMMRCTGRSQDTYKMPSKPIEQGFKFHCLADHGYVWDFVPTSNQAGPDPIPAIAGLTATGSVVYHLLRKLPRARHFVAYLDNFYCTVPLLGKLLSRARPGHRKRPAYEGRVIFGEPGRQQLHHGPGL